MEEKVGKVGKKMAAWLHICNYMCVYVFVEHVRDAVFQEREWELSFFWKYFFVKTLGQEEKF